MAAFVNDEDTGKEAVAHAPTPQGYAQKWDPVHGSHAVGSDCSHDKIVVDGSTLMTPPQDKRSKICGLDKRWFFLLVGVVLVVIVVAATAGGVVAAKASSRSSSDISAQPQTSAPSTSTSFSDSATSTNAPSSSTTMPPLPLATIAADGSLLGINPCPGANKSRYTPGDSRAYTEFCNADWLINTPSQTGSQTPQVNNLDILLADSFHMCIDHCSEWNHRKDATQFACVAVSYRWNITDTLTRLKRPGNCILKTARGQGLPPTNGQAHVAVIDPP